VSLASALKCILELAHAPGPSRSSGGASGGFEEPFGGCGQGVAFGREAGRVGAPGQSGLLAGPQPPAHARAQPSAPWQQEGGLFTGA